MLKVGFGSVAGFFAFLAALFAFLNILKDEKQKPVKDWFGKYWDKVNNSRWLSLPNKIIKFVLSVERLINETPKWLVSNRRANKWIACVALMLCPIAIYGLWGKGVVIGYVIIMPLMILYVAWGMATEAISDRAVNYFLYISLAFCFCVIAYALLYIIFAVPLLYATVVALLSAPLFCVLSVGPIFVIAAIERMIAKNDKKYVYEMLEEYYMPFMLGVALSITITYASFVIGMQAIPSSYIPRTAQMLFSNIIFDGLTMVITVNVLRHAISKPGVFRIPLAVIVDVLAAGLLACCSLYFGLVGTSYALDYQQILYVLIGKSPDGTILQLGPYFWAMHTTFLPTLFYLLVIVIAWFAKALLILVSMFFGEAHQHRNPFKLTATLCTVFSTLLWGLWFGTGVLQEYLKTKENTSPVKTQQIVIPKGSEI